MSVAAMPELDVEARNARVLANQGLVGRVSRSYRNRGLDFDDLMQLGELGLMRAAEKFDPALGYAFSTYATRWIRKFMQWGLLREVRGAGRLAYDPDLHRHPAPEVRDDDPEDRRGAVVAAVARLAPVDRRLVEGVFGVGGVTPRSVTALAAELGVRRENASRRKRRILIKLKGQLAGTPSSGRTTVTTTIRK